MSTNDHSGRRLVAGLAVLFLVLGACSDSDDTSDDISAAAIAANGDDSSGGGSGGGGSGGDDSTTSTALAGSGSDSGAASGDSSGLASVWPLPPGEAEVLFAYTETNDGFSSRQGATFEMTGIDVETAISFYEDYFADTDYVVGARLPLGESIALNISMPDNPNITAVVQASVQSDGKLTLNQERSELIDSSDSGGGDDPGSGSGSDDA